MISNYVNSLKPQLGETWQADELFVKLRGGESIKAGTEIGFLWNIMDRESRFLIASKLTEHRDAGNCIQAFNEAIHNANGKLPQKVHSDSYRVYREGVKVLGNTEHIANCGIAKKPHASNNRAERLNGTLRERTKVQRGWKSKNTLIAEGQRIHYNFVKPHEALKGSTPSDKVGIGVGKGNKWKTLIENSKNSA